MNALLSPLYILFVVSFSAATLLPFGSEGALLAVVTLDKYPVGQILLVASVGNILGSVLNYGLGRMALQYQDRKWFPVTPTTLTKAQGWFIDWGQWTVLLAWVPIIGDPITVAAGVMRMNFAVFFVLVALSKTIRYVLVLSAFGVFL